jgi:hypothetical protein
MTTACYADGTAGVAAVIFWRPYTATKLDIRCATTVLAGT